jgi:hypothetical protein
MHPDLQSEDLAPKHQERMNLRIFRVSCPCETDQPTKDEVRETLTQGTGFIRDTIGTRPDR